MKVFRIVRRPTRNLSYKYVIQEHAQNSSVWADCPNSDGHFDVGFNNKRRACAALRVLKTASDREEKLRLWLKQEDEIVECNCS